MHFVPNIYYKYRRPEAKGNSDTFYDELKTQEYQLTICDQQIYSDKYFFNSGFSQEDDIEEFFDKFERLGLIYISRNYGPMIFKDNTFTDNIGTFGGAITINSPNW